MTDKDKIINTFSNEYRERTINYLKNNFSALQTHDCEDIFQDSIIILIDKISSGENINSSMYTYFVGICKNKALELYRNQKKMPILREEITENEISDDKINYLINLDNDNEEIKNQLIEEFVKKIPEPCNSLFKYCFWDNMKLKTIAQMQNKEVNAVKTAKSRCIKKFKINFSNIINSLTNN